MYKQTNTLLRVQEDVKLNPASEVKTHEEMMEANELTQFEEGLLAFRV